MLLCQWLWAMKLPWKDVSAAPAVSPLGPSVLWGLATAQGGLPFSKGTGITATAWGAEVRVHPFCSQGQGHHHCGGFSFHALLRLQEASPMWWSDAAQGQPAPPLLLRIPSSHHYRPSARLGAAAGTARQHMTTACSFHWNPRLLSIYILFLERGRKSNESETSMVTSAPVLTHTLMEISPVGLTLCSPRPGRRGPEMAVAPGAREAGRNTPSLSSCNTPSGISYRRLKWSCPHRGTCRKQREDRSWGKPVKSPLLLPKP